MGNRVVGAVVALACSLEKQRSEHNACNERESTRGVYTTPVSDPYSLFKYSTVIYDLDEV